MKKPFVMPTLLSLLSGLMLQASQLSPKGESRTLTLASDNKFAYTLVFKEGDRDAKSAANELRAYLRLIAGNVLPNIQSDEEPLNATTPFISVGLTKQAVAAGLGRTFSQERSMAEIRVIDDNLYLCGSITAFDAVMAFLEGDVGCRFFTSEITRYPVAMPLIVNVVPRLETADISRRLILTDYGIVLKGTWALHNRVKNWEHFDHPRDFFCHTYSKIVPMTDFAKTPELFAVVNGKPSNTMICPTHPENIRRAIELTKKYMSEYPDKKLFSIAENDGGYPYCQCPRCMKIIKKHDSPIAAHLTLVNEVARAVKDRAPKQRVEFIVYSKNFRKPPKDFTLEPNTYMWFCTSDMSTEKPLSAFPDKMEEFKEWLRLAPNAAIWEYGVDFSNYFHPVSSFPAKVMDLKLYGGYKLDGVMMQEVTGVRGGDLQHLRAWIFTKLLWNSSLDPYKLAREYCDGVYGAASDEMMRYFRLVNEPGLKQGKTIEEYYGYEAFVKKADQLFKDALKKVSKDEKALRELEIDYLPILTSRLDILYKGYSGNKKQFHKREYGKLLDQIQRISKDYGITQLSELSAMEGYLSERRALLTMLESTDGSFQVYAKNGRLYNYPQVSDPLAEGGVATRQQCDGNWIVQWVLPTTLMEKNKPYQLEVEYRIEHESQSPKACCAGIYDVKNKQSVMTASVSGTKLSTKEYRFIKMGEPFSVTHNGEVYVYFMAPPESDVKSFYVNRIRITPIK